MLRACQEEWNWELNTGIQTLNQRVLGCKLCIISNWVANALLLKCATFRFFLFQAVSCDSWQKASHKLLERYSRVLQANGAWWLLQSNLCYSSLAMVFVHHPAEHWIKAKCKSSKGKFERCPYLSFMSPPPGHSAFLLQLCAVIDAFVAFYPLYFSAVWRGCTFHLLFYDPAAGKPLPAITVINSYANTLHLTLWTKSKIWPYDTFFRLRYWSQSPDIDLPEWFEHMALWQWPRAQPLGLSVPIQLPSLASNTSTEGVWGPRLNCPLSLKELLSEMFESVTVSRSDWRC